MLDISATAIRLVQNPVVTMQMDIANVILDMRAVNVTDVITYTGKMNEGYVKVKLNSF